MDAKIGQDCVELGLKSRDTRSTEARITPSKSDYPRSCVANYERPAPVTTEEDALESVKREWNRLSDNDPPALRTRDRREPVIADLVDFEIYRCPKTDRKRASELTSLHLFDVKAKNLCFDGHIRLGNTKCYVERVKIEDLSIGGYGSNSNPDVSTYLQTNLASRDARFDIWLRLRKPALRYKRFHVPFLWVAVLSKHVMDYMEDQPASSVGLESFAKHFHRWLMPRFGSNKEFQQWFAAFRSATDFRVAFNAHADFLYNQALNLSTSVHLVSHPVWAHCMCGRLMAIPRQPSVVKHTLATPHVYQSFQQMYFASKLKQVSPAEAVSRMQKARKAKLGFPEERTTLHSPGRSRKSYMDTPHVLVGDVVSVIPDSADKTRWQTSDKEWLAYVQGVEPTTTGAQRLVVLWLYRPSDTNIYLANYPVANELFLSDNCNCKEREILLTDVIRKHTVEWSPRSVDTDKEFIIRQTYLTNDSAFVTVKDENKICLCRRPVPQIEWSAGDTVYITKTIDGQKMLEPVVIHDIDFTTKVATVRTLLRLGRDCSTLARQAERKKVAPNELVLTGKLKTISISRIQRACSVRFVPEADVLKDQIPSPYHLGGAGDYWFIGLGLETINGVERLVSLEKLPKGFHEARDSPLASKKLRGLSLFSGGGGLDRGLEEGGAVEFQTSVDYDSAAIHTQRANCTDPQRMRLFCGSVDDYLKALLSGEKNRLVAPLGEVDLIAAGSPCPGFSSLQQNKGSEQSLIYASHITTFCTAVDVYRPLYGILENVVNMASTHKDYEEQNILSQLVACLVSMDYQVNQYIMDAWTYGSCQRRSRIILTIAAPGLEPMLQRPHTHSRSYENTSGRSLGKLPNGERFGDREHYATPYPYVSAEAATSDLPDIGSGNVQACISYPDHRLSRQTSTKSRALLECIPRCPPGCGYTAAMQLGLVPPLLQMTKKETEKSYRRIKADGLIPTITTDISMQDSRNGASVHWSQHRPLSIQDAKRTQGYPDSEPVIGTLNEQWKILGNGVDRKVSFAQGLALRDALTKSKGVPRLSEHWEAEDETMVDAEEETIEYTNEQPKVNLFPGGPFAPSPSSRNSSSTMGTCRQSDLSMSVNGVQEDKHRPITLTVAPFQRQSNTGKRRLPDEGFLSCLSRKVTENVENFSLPVLPSFLHSSQSGVPLKRPREEDEDEQEEDSQPDADCVKRTNTLKTRRTISPARDFSNTTVKLENGHASLPPPRRATHTRSSGPAQFAPRAWNKQSGAANNVIDLS